MGSAGIAAAAALSGRPVEAADAKQAHDHTQVDGPLSQITVSFGQWRTDFDPPLDRFPIVAPATTNRQANNHKLIPYVATIKAGGAVNFLISGTHQILIYDNGTQLADVSSANVVGATAGPPPFPGFVDDPNHRIYRGLNPLPLPQDRAEAVTFPNKGTYLVVCGVLPHFLEGMHGFVKVI
jgi:plastocyanin